MLLRRVDTLRKDDVIVLREHPYRVTGVTTLDAGQTGVHVVVEEPRTPSEQGFNFILGYIWENSDMVEVQTRHG